ncbi:hypothetical protein QUB80_14075 [Chlorogloeopsis sp. ULAP01]|uniref:hypothetical protein n=1 Tax=Chlorogloeopsis sp. ULAP01 TaxID=3056483 RepID=UPI0025AA742D|nr:hypothetical protein [Chlorogloeopsis sp. ULAP01]MDM9381828.1 hypothetical protein [Chlorogloeopsis sp. ULAP01]
MGAKPSRVKSWMVCITWFFVVVAIAILYIYPSISCKLLNNQQAGEINQWRTHNEPP